MRHHIESMFAPKHRRLIALAVVLVLIGGVAALVHSHRHGLGQGDATVADPARFPHVSVAGQLAWPTADEPERQSAGLSPVSVDSGVELPLDAMMVIDEELAANLPPWLPHPQNLAAIEGEDVARRSDGFFSGTLHMTPSAMNGDPAAAYAARLVASGLKRQGSALDFRSADESQRAVLSHAPNADGSPRLTLVYEGFSLDPGCACPGCGQDTYLE